jgi:phosphohistidine phosphatase
MKNLIIIRHAKAEQSSGRDFDRNLMEKGHKDATLMAGRLLNLGYKIDKIFSSPSVRTVQTTAHFASDHNVNTENIKYFDKLYLGDTLAITEAVCWLKENINTLAVVGHNPGVSNFTNDITGSDIDDLPTSGIAIIEVDMNDWENFEGASKKLVKVLTPKDSV